MKIKQILLNPYLHLLCLTLLVVAVFNRTLGSYFLADDFGEVAYVSHIVKGNWSMFWANFSGNYMQIPSMSVWRPWLLVTLLSDFLIWKANPFGYYLTNLVFYIGSVLALYGLICNLSQDWCKTRRHLAAFFSALIFALSPLHCESISWVVGRVDIVCAFYYLICLNAFILALNFGARGEKQKFRWLTALSVVTFWLAMWTKEMAIGAPVLAFAIALLWDQPALAFKKALRSSAPLLLSLPIYFVLRYLALGTLLGGYTQGIGDAQAAGALSHWLDPDTARRLFFPLAYSIYGADSFYLRALSLTYTMLGALLMLRLFSLSLPLRWLLFLPLWLATALAPIYKLWGLGYELEGARFVFFATMPLASFLPVLLLAPHSSASSAKSRSDKFMRPAFAALSLIGLTGLAVMYGKIASHLNLEWVHAGKEVRSFAEQARSLATSTHELAEPPTPLIGIPKRRGGAHMVLNGTTFQILMQPPFANSALRDPFFTYDPIIFGNPDYINATRFKAELNRSNNKFVSWDGESRQLKSSVLRPTAALNLPSLTLPSQTPAMFLHSAGHAVITDQGGKATVEKIAGGDGIYFNNLQLSPLDFDLIAVKLRFVTVPQAPTTLACFWHDDSDLSSVSATVNNANTAEQIVYLRPSQNFRWYEQDKIDHLFLQLPAQTKVQIDAVKLLRAEAAAPQLTIADRNPRLQPRNQIGAYPVREGAMHLRIIAPTDFAQAKMVVDISKANAFFENFNNLDVKNAIEQTLPVQAGEATVPVLAAGANYEIRARAVDAKGQTLGVPSDPLVLRVY